MHLHLLASLSALIKDDKTPFQRDSRPSCREAESLPAKMQGYQLPGPYAVMLSYSAIYQLNALSVIEQNDPLHLGSYA